MLLKFRSDTRLELLCVLPSRLRKKVSPKLWLPWLRLSSQGLPTDLFKRVVDFDSWTFSHSQRFVVRDVRLELSHPHRSRTMIGMGSVPTHVVVGDVLEQFCQIGECLLRIHLASTCAFFHQPLPPDTRLTPFSHSWWQEKQTLTGHCHRRFFWHPRHLHRSRRKCQNHGFVENCHHVLDRRSILDDPSSVIRLEDCDRFTVRTFFLHWQNRTRCICDIKIHTHAASHIWIVAANCLRQIQPSEPESAIGRSSLGSVDMTSAGLVFVSAMAKMLEDTGSPLTMWSSMHSTRWRLKPVSS